MRKKWCDRERGGGRGRGVCVWGGDRHREKEEGEGERKEGNREDIGFSSVVLTLQPNCVNLPHISFLSILNVCFMLTQYTPWFGHVNLVCETFCSMTSVMACWECTWKVPYCIMVISHMKYFSLAPECLLRKEPVGILLQIHQIGVIFPKRARKAFLPHCFHALLIFEELVIS